MDGFGKKDIFLHLDMKRKDCHQNIGRTFKTLLSLCKITDEGISRHYWLDDLLFYANINPNYELRTTRLSL
jgi:uncharacterized protein YegJ (DUF2314 family)